VLIRYQMTPWRSSLLIFELNVIYPPQHWSGTFAIQQNICLTGLVYNSSCAIALCHFWQNGHFMKGRVRNVIERFCHDVIQYVWRVTECHFNVRRILFIQRMVQNIPLVLNTCGLIFFSISFSDCFLRNIEITWIICNQSVYLCLHTCACMWTCVDRCR
jgi:hypothetical protein